MSDSTDPATGEPRTEPASGEPAADGQTPPGVRLEYDGATGTVVKIAVSNSLRTLATLGVYRFWGKTRVRRYLWGRVSFLGDRAEYTGTGRELLLGFIAAIVVLGLLGGSFFGIEMVAGMDHPLYAAVEGTYTAVILFLVFLAEYRARRYRLSRTEWRGIRFAQDGSSLRYALLAFGWGAVTVLSLGTAYPVYRARLQRYRMIHTSFGNRRFEFDGRAADLLKIWLFAWFLLLPSLGSTYVLYRVREFHYFAEKSRCGALSFASDLDTGAMFRIIILSVVLTLLVAGVMLGTIIAFAVTTVVSNPELAEWMLRADASLPSNFSAIDLVGYVIAIAVFFPIMAVLRTLFLIHPLFRNVIPSISVIGEEDYEAIAQSAQSTPRQGEGLADALDVGAV